MIRFEIYILVIVGLVNNAYAESVINEAVVKSPCQIAQALDNHQQSVYFAQQLVDEGEQELVVLVKDVQQNVVTKRITYAHQKIEACHFPALAIARGGDWGWFLAWADTENVYYTRMDGEAYVFVPPKRLPIAQVENIEFLTNQSLLTMRVQKQDGSSQLFVSDDEGRNWQLTQP